MAIPASMTVHNLSGRFTMNKQLTDGDAIDKVLGHQGVGWFKRKAISIGTITLTFKHFTDSNGIEHFNIDNHVTGGIPGTKEERPIDGVERTRYDMHFGHQLFYTKRLAPGSLEGLSEFLRGSWTTDTIEHGIIQTRVKSDTGKSGTSWAEMHTWGIEELEGERRFVRRIEFEGPKKEHIQVAMIFDYVGA